MARDKIKVHEWFLSPKMNVKSYGIVSGSGTPLGGGEGNTSRPNVLAKQWRICKLMTVDEYLPAAFVTPADAEEAVETGVVPGQRFALEKEEPAVLGAGEGVDLLVESVAVLGGQQGDSSPLSVPPPPTHTVCFPPGAILRAPPTPLARGGSGLLLPKRPGGPHVHAFVARSPLEATDCLAPQTIWAHQSGETSFFR